MNALVYLAVVLSCAKTVLSNSLEEVTPCKRDDSECLLKTIKTLYNVAVQGDPSLDVESCDPIHQELIEMNIATLKYKIYNSDASGFSLCSIEKAKLTEVNLYAEMLCPNFTIVGDYEADGQLLTLPIKGKGACKASGTNYRVNVDMEMKKINKDDKIYLSINNFNFTSMLEGDFSLYLENNFDGQPELTDQINKLVSENGKAVSKLVDGPAFSINLKTLAKNINKVLKYISIDKILKD